MNIKEPDECVVDKELWRKLEAFAVKLEELRGSTRSLLRDMDDLVQEINKVQSKI